MSTPLNIFMVNCDWRDDFRRARGDFIDKLDRDRLGASINSFFIFSWSRTGYTANEGNFSTLHRKTRLDVVRPLLDIVALLVIPRIARAQYVGVNAILAPDVWISYDFNSLLALWLARRRCGGIGKIVYVINNQPRLYSMTRRFGLIKAAYLWLLERLFHGIPDHYLTLNATMRSYLEELGIPSERISVFAMDTIERDRVHIARAKKGTIRSRLNISSDTKILLTIARLEAEKNHHELIRLFAGLCSVSSATSEKFVLIILGQGSLRADLETLAEKLGIKDRVVFAGFISREDIWNYYADADVFILLSKVEALGVVVWEAMYMGVPVLGSSADGIVESVGADGERGYTLGDDADPEEFKKKIEACVTTSTERTAMLARARAFVEREISNTISLNSVVHP